MTRKTRKKQKQLWADADFINLLERIKAKRMLKGKKKESLADITRIIAQTPSFRNIEQDMEEVEQVFMRFEQ